MPTGELMVQAQGVQPIEPYRVLQLRPDAPRDLIDEAYWCLIGRANRGRATAATNNRIASLNQAYAFLTDDARRSDRDAGNGFVRMPPRRRRLFGRGRQRSSDRLSHYEVLCVDQDATDDVIAIAYGVLSRRSPAERQGIARARLLEAYHVLTQRYLRAQYDNDAQAVTDKNAAGGQAAMQPRPEAPATARQPSAVRGATESGEERDASRGAIEPRKLIPWRRRAPDDAAMASGAPSPAADPTGRAGNPLTGATAQATPVGSSPIVLRLATPSPHEADRAAVSEEASSRLSSLSHGPPPAVRSRRITYEATAEHAARAELVFTAGQRVGERLLIGDTVNLDDGGVDNDEYRARISVYGAKFAFRIAASTSAAVNGHLMTLPLIFLDDGDLISLGDHQLRFSVLAEPASPERAPSTLSG